MTRNPQQDPLRAFKVDTVEQGPHQFSFVSLDDMRIGFYQYDEAICPPDRIERVSEVVDGSDLALVEYFPDEVERNVFSAPILGKVARDGFGISPDYYGIAKAAHDNGNRLGTADIANRLAYAPWGWPPSLQFSEKMAGSHSVAPTKREKYLPTSTDARRLITAEAMLQEADRHPEGTHIAYVGAPAHVNRVKDYVTKEQTWWDRARLAGYLTNMDGLDKSLRIYEPTLEGWRLAEKHPIKVAKDTGAVALLTSFIKSQ